MFGFKIPNEKYITDINLEISKINRNIEQLIAKYDKLEELYLSIKGRTNKSKPKEEEETTNSVLLPA